MRLACRVLRDLLASTLILGLLWGLISCFPLQQSTSPITMFSYSGVILNCSFDLRGLRSKLGCRNSGIALSWQQISTLANGSDITHTIAALYGEGRTTVNRNGLPRKILGNFRKGQFNLKITELMPDFDDGGYYCAATNLQTGQFVRSKTIYLKIEQRIAKPEVIFYPEEDELIEGQNVTILCSSRDIQPAKLKWRFQNDSVISAVFHRMFHRDEHDDVVSQVVFELRKEHHGLVLFCRAENENKSQAFERKVGPLRVKYKSDVKIAVETNDPTLRSPTANSVIVAENTFVSLICSVDCYPALTSVNWKKDGESLPDHNPKLILGPVIMKSSTKYSCYNPIDATQSAEVKLMVRHSPLVTVTPSRLIYPSHDGNSTLICLVEREASPFSFEWYNPEEELVSTRNVLDVSQLTEKISGDYRCQAAQPNQGVLSRRGSSAALVHFL